MRKNVKIYPSQMVNDQLEKGESIEQKMFRVTTTNEPIENVAPLMYTERKDGVLPETDFRTDRMAIAQEAMGACAKSNVAKREEQMKVVEEENK